MGEEDNVSELEPFLGTAEVIFTGIEIHFGEEGSEEKAEREREEREELPPGVPERDGQRGQSGRLTEGEEGFGEDQTCEDAKPKGAMHQTDEAEQEDKEGEERDSREDREVVFFGGGDEGRPREGTKDQATERPGGEEEECSPSDGRETLGEVFPAVVLVAEEFLAVGKLFAGVGVTFGADGRGRIDGVEQQ